jgi:integrase
MPAIITAPRTASPKTVAELLRRFGAAPELRPQGQETVRTRRLLQRIDAQFGHLTIPEVERPEFRARVYDWRDAMADTPAECERTIRLLNRSLAWGVDRGHLRENRLEGVRYRWRRDPRRRADITWSPAQIGAIRPYLGPIADAFELSLWTGLRQGDVLKLEQGALGSDGWLSLMPEKTAARTGIRVCLPAYALAPLNALIKRLRSGERELVLTRAWNPRSFRRLFDRAEAAAGLGEHDLHWHDLRGTLVTWLFEAECTPAEVAAVIGHAPATGIAKRYAAQSRVYAGHAFLKLDRYMTENHREFYAASVAAGAGFGDPAPHLLGTGLALKRLVNAILRPATVRRAS